MINGDTILSVEERMLLAYAVLEQNYAVEVVSNLISDVEKEEKIIDVDLYKKFLKLYDKLKDVGE